MKMRFNKISLLCGYLPLKEGIVESRPKDRVKRGDRGGESRPKDRVKRGSLFG
jgi:hypothetical protein